MVETIKIPVCYFNDDVTDINMRANFMHQKLSEISLWLEENVYGYYYESCERENDIVYGIYIFLEEEDAFLFKMTWLGD